MNNFLSLHVIHHRSGGDFVESADLSTMVDPANGHVTLVQIRISLYDPGIRHETFDHGVEILNDLNGTDAVVEIHGLGGGWSRFERRNDRDITLVFLPSAAIEAAPALESWRDDGEDEHRLAFWAGVGPGKPPHAPFCYEPTLRRQSIEPAIPQDGTLLALNCDGKVIGQYRQQDGIWKPWNP